MLQLTSCAICIHIHRHRSVVATSGDHWHKSAEDVAVGCSGYEVDQRKCQSGATLVVAPAPRRWTGYCRQDSLGRNAIVQARPLARQAHPASFAGCCDRERGASSGIYLIISDMYVVCRQFQWNASSLQLKVADSGHFSGLYSRTGRTWVQNPEFRGGSDFAAAPYFGELAKGGMD